MATPLQKIVPGQRFQIPAGDWNAFIDVARAHRGGQLNLRGGALAGERLGNIQVRNDTGSDRHAFDVVGLAGPIFGPDDNLNEFQRRVTMRVIAPDAAAIATGRIAILAEPLTPGRIGRAYIYGTCVCRVKILDPTHASAVPVAGVTDHLESAAEGPIQVLWSEPVASGAIAWSLIRLGGGGGGSTQIRIARLVDYWWTDPPAYVVGYRGYLIATRNAIIPPDEIPTGDDLLYLGVWAFPPPIPGRDLRYYAPGIPLDVPGAADVPVLFVADQNIAPANGGGMYMVLFDHILTCAGGG